MSYLEKEKQSLETIEKIVAKAKLVGSVLEKEYQFPVNGIMYEFVFDSLTYGVIDTIRLLMDNKYLFSRHGMTFNIKINDCTSEDFEVFPLSSPKNLTRIPIRAIEEFKEYVDGKPYNDGDIASYNSNGIEFDCKMIEGEWVIISSDYEMHDEFEEIMK